MGLLSRHLGEMIGGFVCFSSSATFLVDLCFVLLGNMFQGNPGIGGFFCFAYIIVTYLFCFSQKEP